MTDSMTISKEDMLADNDEDIFQGYGIEILLMNREDFTRVREVLTRMGEAEGKDLHQCCYILHKRGRYIIAHHRELANLDGKPSDVSEKDVAIRNKIADLLEEWQLVLFVDPDAELLPMAEASEFKIITYKDKRNWNLLSPYKIGVDKRKDRPPRRRYGE